MPSTQHSSSPAAKLPHVPAAHASACASRPSSLPAPYGDAEGCEQPGGMKAASMELARATTTPTRHAISLAIAIARIASRPITGRVSASASAAATDGLLMCTIDSLCVSSNSSACGNDALANAACVRPTLSPLPEDPARPLRRDGNSARANRPAESRPFARERQADHIKDAKLRRLDHIVRKVVESNARNPLCELTGKRHDHSPGA